MALRIILAYLARNRRVMDEIIEDEDDEEWGDDELSKDEKDEVSI